MNHKPIKFRAVHEKTRWRKASHETIDNATSLGKRSARALFDYKNDSINYDLHGAPLYVVIWDGDAENADGFIVKKNKRSGELELSSSVPRSIIEKWEDKKGIPDNLMLDGYFATDNTSKLVKPENVQTEFPVDDVTYALIKSRRGQSQFRQSLLSEFNGTCCISQSTTVEVLEAAHITPHTQETNYSITNGLLLRADIHTLFDLNLIGIDENGMVHISPSLQSSEYCQYEGTVIRRELPEEMSSNLKQRYELFNN